MMQIPLRVEDIADEIGVGAPFDPKFDQRAVFRDRHVGAAEMNVDEDLLHMYLIISYRVINFKHFIPLRRAAQNRA